MIYLWISNTILIIHGLFIVFVMAGGLLVLRWPRLIWLHLPAVIWGILVEMRGWICPLTPWENHFRELAGQAAYEGGFIAEYLLPLIYPHDLTRETQLVLGGIVFTVNLLVYLLIWQRWKKQSSY